MIFLKTQFAVDRLNIFNYFIVVIMTL